MKVDGFRIETGNNGGGDTEYSPPLLAHCMQFKSLKKENKMGKPID